MVITGDREPGLTGGHGHDVGQAYGVVDSLDFVKTVTAPGFYPEEEVYLGVTQSGNGLR